MKKSLVLFVLIIGICSSSLKAQLNAADSLFFQAYEDTLNAYSDSLFNSSSEPNRIFASQAIAKNLTKALKRENSFQYGFPNLKAISVLQAQDQTFKIFTYQLIRKNNTYKYFGAVQMNSPTLQLIPLIDKSDMMDDDVSTLLADNNNWLGALYYNIHKVKVGDQDYYTIFGYDGNNALSTKKIIDVLWFASDGSIKFGAPLFDVKEKELKYRFIIEYRKEVAAGANYSDEMKKIIFDHLIPEDPAAEGQYFTYVPDGSYDGFEWKKDRWVFFEHLETQKLKDGEFPIGN
jgi:hypothetical protein